MKYVTGLVAVIILAMGISLTAMADRPRDWRMLETENFYLYYPVEKEEVLQRFAALAEATHQRLTQVFPKKSPYKTHVVISDERDISNGLASPFPYPKINLDLATPVDDFALGLGQMDWLEMVFTHEYAHILQLGAVDGAGERLRRIFGSWVLSGAFVPPWTYEGWAVYAESNLGPAEGGRLRDASFRRMLSVDWMEENLKGLAQVSNPLLTWPGNMAWYAYGALFHEYLAVEYGEDKLVAFYQRLAQNPPFITFEQVFRDVFGLTLTNAYQQWQRQLPAQVGALAPYPGQRVTTEAVAMAFPCWDEEGNLYYVEERPRRPTRLMKGKDGRFTAVANWDTQAEYVVLPDGTLVFTQLRWEGDRLYYDLYRANERKQKRQRLTTGQRATQPTRSPDGKWVVFTANDPPLRHIKLLNVDSGEVTFLLKGDERESFSAPAWSPDGKSLAVVVERKGNGRRIELLNLTTKQRKPLTGRWWAEAEPTWAPSGRFLLFTAEQKDHRNLYAYDLENDEIRLLIDDGGQGVVSPDGQTLAYLGVTASGPQLYLTAFDPLAGAKVILPDDPAPRVAEVLPAVAVKTSGYRPGPSLKPYFWFPLPFYNREHGLGLGVYTFGQDVLDFYRYNLFFGINTDGKFSYDFSFTNAAWGPELTLTVNPEIGYGLNLSQLWRSSLVDNDALRIGAGWKRNAGWSTGFLYTTARVYGLNPEPSRGLELGLNLSQFGAGELVEATFSHYTPFGDGRLKGEVAGALVNAQKAKFGMKGYAQVPIGQWAVRAGLGVKAPLVMIEQGFITPPLYVLDCWGGFGLTAAKVEDTAGWWPALEAELNLRTTLGFYEFPFNFCLFAVKGLVGGHWEWGFTAGLPF